MICRTALSCMDLIPARDARSSSWATRTSVGHCAARARRRPPRARSHTRPPPRRRPQHQTLRHVRDRRGARQVPRALDAADGWRVREENRCQKIGAEPFFAAVLWWEGCAREEDYGGHRAAGGGRVWETGGVRERFGSGCGEVGELSGMLHQERWSVLWLDVNNANKNMAQG